MSEVEEARKSEPVVNSDRPLRICFAAHDPGTQGAERALLDMAVLFRSSGWDVTVLIPGRQGGLWKLAESHGFRPRYVYYLYWMGPGGWLGRARRACVNLHAFYALRRFIRQERFDVIYTHSTAVGVTALAARSAGAAHVWHMHEFGAFGLGRDGPVYDLGARATLALMRKSESVFVAVANVIADAFRPHLGRDADIRVVYQPVPFDETPAPADAEARRLVTAATGPRILCVGAVTPTKRQEDAVRAMPTILARHPGARLFLVGRLEEKYWAKLTTLGRKLGVSQAVVSLGLMENAPAIVGMCDVMLNCRLVEASPRVLVESMFAKTITIAAGAGGNVESIPEGMGLLYAPTDPEDLASKVLWVLDHPEERVAIEDRAHAFAMESRSEDAYAAKYVKSIEEAIRAAVRMKLG